MNILIYKEFVAKKEFFMNFLRVLMFYAKFVNCLVWRIRSTATVCSTNVQFYRRIHETTVKFK